MGDGSSQRLKGSSKSAVSFRKRSSKEAQNVYKAFPHKTNSQINKMAMEAIGKNILEKGEGGKWTAGSNWKKEVSQIKEFRSKRAAERRAQRVAERRERQAKEQGKDTTTKTPTSKPTGGKNPASGGGSGKKTPPAKKPKGEGKPASKPKNKGGKGGGSGKQSGKKKNK